MIAYVEVRLLRKDDEWVFDAIQQSSIDRMGQELDWKDEFALQQGAEWFVSDRLDSETDDPE